MRIAFGDGSAAGKLKAFETLSKHIGLFTSKKLPKVKQAEEEVRGAC